MLTDAELKNTRGKSKSYKKTDRDGLYVLVTPSGAIAFKYDYRFNGRRETVTFGSYGLTGLSLARAREKLIEAKRMIAEGVSPALEKQRAKRRLGARTSLADLARHAADGPGPVVTVLGPEYVLQEDVRAQLAQVEGLDFAITKKHLWYDFKGIRGSSPFRGGTDEFTRFERFIVDNKVTDGFAVIKALREDA